MSELAYYPGCSMDGSARAYQRSLDLVCRTLGLNLREIDDWNCCGATEYAGISLLQSNALIARNLAIAEAQLGGKPSSGETPARTAVATTPQHDASASTASGGSQGTLITPCSACYLNLAKTDAYLRESPHLAHQVNDALGQASLHYTPGAVRVRHVLDAFLDDVGLDAIAGHVVKPLKGLRVAPYLGCMLPRPDLDDRWAHEHPVAFDELLAALGAEVVDYPLKTDCCGGHMTQISPGTGFELIRRLVHEATARGADLMATVCPMCQMNVDAYQGEMNRYFQTHYRMPILFFTQLMAIAFGASSEDAGIGSEFVDPRQALGAIGVEVPPPTAETPAGGQRPHRPGSRRSTALPMPTMSGKETRR
jgi:heterodisulfide reductase subunit B